MKKPDPTLLAMQVAFEAVMRSWEFINHLGEAAMGVTFGEIRARPTLCPTFYRTSSLAHVLLVYSGLLSTLFRVF